MRCPTEMGSAQLVTCIVYIHDQPTHRSVKAMLYNTITSQNNALHKKPRYTQPIGKHVQGSVYFGNIADDVIDYLYWNVY